MDRNVRNTTLPTSTIFSSLILPTGLLPSDSGKSVIVLTKQSAPVYLHWSLPKCLLLTLQTKLEPEIITHHNLIKFSLDLSSSIHTYNQYNHYLSLLSYMSFPFTHFTLHIRFLFGQIDVDAHTPWFHSLEFSV